MLKKRQRPVPVSYRVAMLLVLSCGLVLRLATIKRPISVDEAWVANAVLEARWSDMFHNPAWLQTTPPLLLVLLRWSVDAFGVSEAAFRAVPLLFGMTSLALAVVLGAELFSATYAFVFVTLVALSPAAAYYSLEIKPYGADLCLALLLSWLVVRYYKGPTRKNFCYLLAAFSVGLTLSYPALFFVPAALMAIILAGQRETQPEMQQLGMQQAGLPQQSPTAVAVRRALVLSAACCLISLSVYLLMVRPNRQPQLESYWDAAFPTAHPTALAHLYAGEVETLGAGFFTPTRLGETGAWIWIALALYGTATMMTVRAQVARTIRLVLILGPLASLFMANVGRLYPLVSPRLQLFALAPVAIAAVCGIESAVELCQRRLRALTAVLPNGVVAGCVLVAILVVIARLRSPSPVAYEDTPEALRYLRSALVPGDALLVHRSVAQQFALYRRLLDMEDLHPEFGSTGAPCCPRDQTPARGMVPRDVIDQDFALHAHPEERRPVWLLITARPDHWAWLGRDETPMLLDSAIRFGCHPAGALEFGQLRLMKIDCTTADPHRGLSR